MFERFLQWYLLIYQRKMTNRLSFISLSIIFIQMTFFLRLNLSGLICLWETFIINIGYYISISICIYYLYANDTTE